LKVNSEEHERERDSSDRVHSEELKYYNSKYVDTLFDSPVLKCIAKVENYTTLNRWKYGKLGIPISNKWIENLVYGIKEEKLNHIKLLRRIFEKKRRKFGIQQ
jgi:hypothetical protein